MEEKEYEPVKAISVSVVPIQKRNGMSDFNVYIVDSEGRLWEQAEIKDGWHQLGLPMVRVED